MVGASERNASLRPPYSWSPMQVLPVRSSTRPMIVDRPPLVVPPRRATPRTPTHKSPRESAESVDKSRSSSSSEGQKARTWTASGGSLLDELASWRKLKEPLERYLAFVRCDHFGCSSNSDQSATDDEQLASLADNNGGGLGGGGGADTAGVRLSLSAVTIRHDDCRLLHRQRADQFHFVPRHRQWPE